MAYIPRALHGRIAGTIADLGYTGFVAHEWRPAMGNDPVKSLERCFEIMHA
jgi:hypothetical protein